MLVTRKMTNRNSDVKRFFVSDADFFEEIQP